MTKKEINILKLRPNDCIIFNGGLKVQNVSEDNYIEVEMPNRYSITPMINIDASTIKEDPNP